MDSPWVFRAAEERAVDFAEASKLIVRAGATARSPPIVRTAEALPRATSGDEGVPLRPVVSPFVVGGNRAARGGSAPGGRDSLSNDADTLECWTAITYLAAAFPKLDFGAIVLCQSYRSPAVVAKMGATLQLLTGGRFVLGLGAGWRDDEYDAYGFDFPKPSVRLAQLEESIHIIQKMWSGGPATYEGKYYQIRNAYCEPTPDPVPPLLIGGGGASLTAFDAIRKYGGRPANYCEIGGNPTVLKVKELTKLILRKEGVEKLAVITNVVSNTRVDLVARGVIKGILELGEEPSERIAIFRVPGSWEDEGFRILKRYGVSYCDRHVSIDEAARRAVAACQADISSSGG